MIHFLLMLISIVVAQPIHIDLIDLKIFSQTDKKNEIYIHILEMNTDVGLKEYVTPQPPFYFRSERISAFKGLDLCTTSLDADQENTYVISFLERSTSESEIDKLLGGLLLKLGLTDNRIKAESKLISPATGQNLVVEGNTARVYLPNELDRYEFTLSWSASE
jgi:hypothetical protein